MNGILCLADYSVNHREIKPISELGADLKGNVSFEDEINYLKGLLKSGVKDCALKQGVSVFSSLVLDRQEYVGFLRKETGKGRKKVKVSFLLGGSHVLNINKRLYTLQDLGVDYVSLVLEELDTGRSKLFEINDIANADVDSVLNTILTPYDNKLVYLHIGSSFNAGFYRELPSSTIYNIVAVSDDSKIIKAIASYGDFKCSLEAIKSDAYISELKRGKYKGFIIMPKHTIGHITVGVLNIVDKTHMRRIKDSDTIIVSQGTKSMSSVSKYLNKYFLDKIATVEVTSLEGDEEITVSGTVTRQHGVTYVGGKPLHGSLLLFKGKKVIVNIK